MSNKYLLDTCALYWLLFEDDNLSNRVKKILDHEYNFYISAFSCWEIAQKVKRGTLKIPLSIEEFQNLILSVDDIQIIDINVKTLISSVSLDWENKDPADRIIASLALELKIPVITTDSKLTEFFNRYGDSALRVVWN